MFFTLLVDYVRWHYGEALVHYLRILKTYWWFVVAYFSPSLLITTLFDPLPDSFERHIHKESLWGFLQRTIINCLSRFIGATIRLSLIVITLVLLSFVTVGGIVGYVLWLIAPGVPALLTGAGIFLLVSSLLGI